jgi:hypothetical protein
MSYIDYAWARATRVGRWEDDSEAIKQVQAITKGDPPFYGVVMLAMMRADSINAAKLRAAWPAVWDECQARYDSPGALLDSDPEPLRTKVLG